MANPTGPFGTVTRAARVALIVSLLVMALTFAACLTAALYFSFETTPRVGLMAQLIVIMLASLIVAVWAIVAHGMVRVVIANEAHVYNAASRLERLETAAGRHAELLRELRDLAKLSDKAKGLLSRDHEREAFREAIHHHLPSQDYDAAEHLLQQIERLGGYDDEAATLRQEVEAYRNSSLDQKVQAAVARVERFIDAHQWARALREAQRLSGLFGDNERVAGLSRQVHLARAKHKRDLLQAYGEAARKNDVDRSIALLKELDAYLTPQEAAALSESARGVFKARLHNLGVQFAIYVEDESWSRAVAAGEEIIREFPNSRMAQEVKQKMDTLKSRAAATSPSPQPQEPQT